MISRRVLLTLPLVLGCRRGERAQSTPAPSSLSWAPPPRITPVSSTPEAAPAAPGASSGPASSTADAAPGASSDPTRPRRARAAPLLDAEGRPTKLPTIALVPEPRTPSERFPALIALHGLGEARKGPERGAWGWVRDYALDVAFARLAAGDLRSEDFHGFVTPSRLTALRDDLARRPFAGLAVLCAYTPDLLQRPSLDNAKELGRRLFDEVLPAARATLPILAAPHATGIDGVSLGGRAALLVGLAHPRELAAVGALQAAIQLPEAEPLAARAAIAIAAQPSLRLRLVTSKRDFYRAEIAALDAALTRRDVPHRHEVLPGPHDYPWNQGPGALEMLLYHDRVLRGMDAI